MFAHLFGVSEDEVMATWTVERWERYRQYAKTVTSQGQGG